MGRVILLSKIIALGFATAVCTGGLKRWLVGPPNLEYFYPR
jgi:hypothetical protein